MTESAALVAAPGVRSARQTILLALTLAVAPAVAVGFGRFAYALILPSMRADLGWNFQQSGALNTANALGYLLGAVITAQAVKRFPLRSVLLLSLAISVAALLLAGMTRLFPLLLTLRALIGFSAAFTFISATGLGTRLGRDASENALALGLTTSGPGWGTAISGAILPFVLENHVSRWTSAWELLGILGMAALAMVWFGTRSLPDGALAATDTAATVDNAKSGSLAPLLPAMLAYFLFGLGYIAYMTFLVAYVRSLSSGAATVAAVYVALGAAMVGGVFVWRRFLSIDRGGIPLAMMGLLGASAAILPYFSSALPVLILSAIAFGIASMPVFTAITLLIRRHLPQSAWTPAIAWATVIFAVGQSLGPLGSGALSDHFGLSASLWWTTVIMSIGACVALFQRKQSAEERK